jgi:ubiquitin carboxyl-terminal hydrolase 34
MRIDDGRKPNMVDNKGRMVDDNLLHQLQVLFGYLSKTERMEYNPQDFCFSWKDMNGEPANLIIQQDAQEFISMLLDRLEEGMKKTPFRKIVDCTYTGQVSNLFTCEQCKKMKSREENFYCLSLEVKNYKNLEQSLGKLIKGETISDYTCDFCGKKVEVVKKTVISKCPNYLVLHLQRLVFNLDTFLNEKISDRFEFPLELNLQPYTLESTLSTPQQPQTSPQSP